MNVRTPRRFQRILDPLTVLLFLVGVGVFVRGMAAGGWWQLLGAAFGVGALLVVYGVFVEPKLLQVVRFEEPLVPSPTSWVRFVWLSDFHAGGFRDRDWYERVAIEVQALDPDVIVLGGDVVADLVDPLQELKPLARLTAHLGKYFVLGNHDFLDDPALVRRTLSEWTYRDITNTHLSVQKGGATLQVTGLDDCWYGSPDVGVFRADTQMPHVTLAHEPDAVLDLAKEKTDLVLCGHTHGGAIRLPFIGPLARIPSILGRKADRGRRIVNGVPMVISQGIGESDLRARLFCRPQIVVVEVGI